MSVIKNFATSLFIIAVSVSCSTTIEQLEIKYNNDFSGTAKATILVNKDQSKTEELHKASNACDIDLREIYGYDKKFIAEYKFDSYETLKNAPECSKITNESVSFEDLKIKDGVLTKDVTFKMKLKGWSIVAIKELIIFIPGKVQEVRGVWSRYYDENAASNSTKVSFSLAAAFEAWEKEMKRECNSYSDSKKEVCWRKVASYQDYLIDFENNKFKELSIVITTRINKFKEFVEKAVR